MGRGRAGPGGSDVAARADPAPRKAPARIAPNAPTDATDAMPMAQLLRVDLRPAANRRFAARTGQSRTMDLDLNVGALFDHLIGAQQH